MSYPTDLNVVTAAQVLMKQSFFWKPDHLSRSPGLLQVPLVFWMMDLIQPDTVISVDETDGAVLSAVWQTTKHLSLRCKHYLFASSSSRIETSKLRNSKQQANAQPLPDLEAIPDQSVGLVTVEVSDLAMSSKIDWEQLYRKLNGNGVCLIYGAAAERADLSDLPEHFMNMTLGDREMTAVLLLAPHAPAVLRELASSSLHGVEGKKSVETLLRHQADFLDQLALIRSYPPLFPDPTAPELEEPRDLEEARNQIAQLVELHARDLETVAARLDSQREEHSIRERELNSEIHELQLEMARKDRMLEVLNHKLAELHAANEKSSGRKDQKHSWISRIFR